MGLWHKIQCEYYTCFKRAVYHYRSRGSAGQSERVLTVVNARFSTMCSSPLFNEQRILVIFIFVSHGTLQLGQFSLKDMICKKRYRSVDKWNRIPAKKHNEAFICFFLATSKSTEIQLQQFQVTKWIYKYRSSLLPLNFFLIKRTIYRVMNREKRLFVQGTG